MRAFRIVFGMEFRETVRSRPFIVISVVFAIMLAAAAGVSLLAGVLANVSQQPEIVPDQLVEITPDQSGSMAIYAVAADDRSERNIIDRLEKRLPQIRFERCTLDDAIIADALERGVDGCIIISSEQLFDYYSPSSLYDFDILPDMISRELTEMAREDAFGKLGVSLSDAQAAMNINADYIAHSIGGFSYGKYLVSTIITVLLFVSITLYGQMVATRVTAEKGSRTVEVLAASVSPEAMLCGKVLGVGAAALLQMAVFFSGLCLCAGGIFGNMTQQLIGISALDGVWMCSYFLLGFALTAFIYGGLGAMVSQTEDLSGIASLPILPLSIGYFISLIAASLGEGGLLLTIASYVPFWSPLVMFSRMALEEVSTWEILLSLLILLITTVLAARLSARLYRRGMLRYGKPPKLKEYIDSLKKSAQ